MFERQFVPKCRTVFQNFWCHVDYNVMLFSKAPYTIASCIHCLVDNLTGPKDMCAWVSVTRVDYITVSNQSIVQPSGVSQCLSGTRTSDVPHCNWVDIHSLPRTLIAVAMTRYCRLLAVWCHTTKPSGHHKTVVSICGMVAPKSPDSRHQLDASTAVQYIHVRTHHTYHSSVWWHATTSIVDIVPWVQVACVGHRRPTLHQPDHSAAVQFIHSSLHVQCCCWTVELFCTPRHHLLPLATYCMERV